MDRFLFILVGAAIASAFFEYDGRRQRERADDAVDRAERYRAGFYDIQEASCERRLVALWRACPVGPAYYSVTGAHGPLICTLTSTQSGIRAVDSGVCIRRELLP